MDLGCHAGSLERGRGTDGGCLSRQSLGAGTAARENGLFTYQGKGPGIMAGRGRGSRLGALSSDLEGAERRELQMNMGHRMGFLS